MGLNAFILLPVNDDALLAIGDTIDDLKKFITTSKELFDKIKRDDDKKLFYDSSNFETFIEKYKALPVQEDLPKVEDLSKKLRSILGKSSRDIQDRQNALALRDIRYILWNLNNFEKITYAPAILSEITERVFKNAEEKYLLLNVGDALEADRKVFLVFRDALYKQDLPDKFAHIPYVKDVLELELWLATYHVKTFSLLDKNRFRRTSEVQQGKPVFQEIETNYYWYLDNFHKNEYEVFDSKRGHIGVADLEGNLDESKRKKGRTF